MSHRTIATITCVLGVVLSGWAGLRAYSQDKTPKAISIQQLVDRAYQDQRSKIRIAPGIYEIYPPEKGPHLQFHNLSHFEIDARGVTLLLTDPRRGGIEFRGCDSVTFRGATIRYATPPFTQGSIEAIAADGSWYDVRIDKGYPVNLEDRSYFPSHPTGYLFDRRTRWWKADAYDLNAKRVERLQPDLFRFYWSTPMGPGIEPVAVGDLIAFRGAGRHNLTIVDSTKMRVEDVTIQNAGSFAVWENGGTGRNRYTITVKRGPKPLGAESDPLLSSTADAFHSVDVRHGPTVEHSWLESMPDDGIAIHGTYALIFEGHENRLIINKSTFEPGDPIRIYDADGRPSGEAVVRMVVPRPDYHDTRKSGRVTLSDNTRGPYFELTLDRPVNVNFDYLAENPAATGAGYILRDNTIRNHRARGMLLKAPNGLVEHNEIDGSTMGGIVLTPEFWWNEAGYSRNVIIRNNVIRHVAYAPRQLGGLVVAALDGAAPVAGYGNRDVLIENNRFEGINGVNLLITSAADVKVKNNRFINAQTEPGEAAGVAWGEDPGALIFVTQATGIRFTGNKAEGLGKYNRVLVETTPSAHVVNEGNGVVISK